MSTSYTSPNASDDRGRGSSTGPSSFITGRPDDIDDIDLSPIYANSDSEGDGTPLAENFSGMESSDEEVFDNSEPSNTAAAMSPPYNSQESSFSVETLRNKENAGSSNAFENIEKFEESAPYEVETSTRLRIKIKRLKIVGQWKWADGKEDNCGICRTSFETCCVDCKFPGDECPLVLGVCKHPFHFHCIVKWTNSQSGQQKPACPLCRQEWKFATS